MRKPNRDAAGAWERHNRSQLRYFRSLSLRQKMEAVEGMADLVRRFERMRAEGAFYPSPAGTAKSGAPSGLREGTVAYQGQGGRCDLDLYGCTPEPLMAYLKALGVLRLVSEQKDAEARGWWENDVFWLRSPVLFKEATTEEARRTVLVKFFLEEYKPTPIVAPWAGGSGFFRKDNKKAVNALSESDSPRVHSYARVIENVRAIINDESIGDKPRDEDKARLIRRYRRELPDEVVAWMDAAMVLQRDRQGFAPLLGTGGNDGRLDFTQNFMQRVVSLGLHKTDPADEKSRAWIEQALFATPATLDKASVGQFAPGRAGGANATHGMEGESTDNPWDFVLMMEGALLFAGAAVRRFGVVKSSRAAFPFTVRAVSAGFDSAASRDEAESRGELWLPLWTRPTSTRELRQLFGEARAETSGRPVRDGTDFARAVAGLGTDRGITGFSRFGFLKRSGKAFLAAPLGRFEVIERSGVDLIREIDPWLDVFRRAAGDKNAPPGFVSALRRIDSAILEFCKYGGESLFQEIVIAVGAAERELAAAERFRDEKKLQPLAGLSPAWIEAANDGSREFAVARALASAHDLEAKIGSLRVNLEPVDWKKHCRKWAEKDRAVVWNAADLATNLANVLQRRLMDGARVGCEHLPLASRFTVPLDNVAAFVAGELNDKRIEELIWGLMLIDDRGDRSRSLQGASDSPLPRAYALLKLLFLPRPLVIERGADGELFAHLLRDNEHGEVVIRPEPSILQLLRGGRVGEACVKAMRRLRSSGLDPMPRPIRGCRVRDEDWRELDRMGGAGVDPQRLAAALLIPISNDAVCRLVRLVIRSDEMGGKQAETGSAMNLEGGRLS